MRFLLCLLAVLVLGAAHAQISDWQQDYRKVDVADGIVSFIADESPGGVVQGNVTLIDQRAENTVRASGYAQTSTCLA